MTRQPRFSFNVIYENTLSRLDETLSSNQYLMSIVNDYEDGQWRQDVFLRFILDNLVQTALSYEERNKMIGDPFSALCYAAPRLRIVAKDKGKGGEIAEICLYGIMRKYFNALPVVPKIFHKQNSKDNAKGADSVHILVNGDKTFSLWLGEAKFYNNLNSSRLDDPVQSVLNTIANNSLRKENSIITDLKDIDCLIDDDCLAQEIKETLSPEVSLDRIKKLLNIPILLLYQCDITRNAMEFTDEVKNQIIDFHTKSAIQYFKKLVEKQKESPIFKFDEIKFHLILFPVHDKQNIVDGFYKQIDSFLRL